jgi:Tfp pilus assembly protein PilF
LKRRLNSWKEVAAFFGRTERTVMRWEMERGLPIRRLPGESRSRIYAESEELEAWLKGAPEEPTDKATATPLATPRRWQRWAIAAGAVLTLAATVGLSATFWHPVYRPSPAAEALYLKGIQDWNQRTPESLGRAVDEFNQAIAVDPQYARPYAGLALSYDLLREYTAMPSAQAFEAARTNAEHAIRLDERLGIAHAALAFALYHGYGDVEHARRQFDRALELEPGNPTIQHWYATFLMSQADFARALEHINRALEIDPSSRAIRADRAIIMARAGQIDAAIAILQQMERAEPDFRSPHSYLSQIYFSLKPDDAAFIRETRASAQMTGDLYGESLMQAAESGLRLGGHRGMLRALLDGHLAQFKKGVGSAVAISEICTMLGDDTRAVAYFKMAVDRNEEEVKYYRHWAEYHRLKSNPAFQAQLRRLPQGT